MSPVKVENKENMTRHAIHQSFVRTISCVRKLVRTFVYFQGYSPKRAYVRKCKNCAYISERYTGCGK